MIDLKNIIEQCFKRCKPPVQLYSVDNEGDYHAICDEAVADIESATEELTREIGNYLHIKEAEISSKLVQVKCDAYELALTHSRPIERTREEEE